MNLIREFVLNSRRLALTACIASVVCGASRVGLLIITNLAIVSEAISPAIPLAFIGLCALLLGSAIVSETMLVRIAQNCVFKLRLELSRHILATPLRQLQSIGRDRLNSVFSDDIANIANALSLMPIICIDGSMILGCLVYIGWLSWSLLLTVAAFMALGIASFQVLQGRALHWLHSARESSDGLYAHFRSLIEGNKELKMHKRRRAAFFDTQFRVAAENIRQKIIQGKAFYTLADHWGNLLFYLAIGAVLFVHPGMAAESRLKVGFVLSVLYLMGPLASLMIALPGVGKGVAALRYFNGMKASLAAPDTEEVDAEDCFGLTHDPAVLELRNIRHAYYHDRDERSFTLGPIDLTIHPGELVFLIGGNGSGKTTLAMIILGLYTPDHGEIYLNGVLVTDANRDAYRQHFAAVFADAFLFDSLFGHEDDAVTERVHELLGKLQLKHKVKLRDNRFSTLDLSQGQRKRLALLSAYLDNRAFYLFDEWAAEQDPIFKNLFYTELLPELKAQGKTVLVITHDDQYYHLADRCIRFDSGQIMDWLISTKGIRLSN
jgi:putative ATP-binding cassette transporter